MNGGGTVVIPADAVASAAGEAKARSARRRANDPADKTSARASGAVRRPGIQCLSTERRWVPAFAGTTRYTERRWVPTIAGTTGK